MTGFENIQNIYFLGIGGIGMSALARWFNHLGFRVAGYDRTSTALTTALQSEGIEVHFDDRGEKVQTLVGQPKDTLVVFTPALPADHGEWNWLQQHGYSILKRSKVLGMLCNRSKCLAVAGTHGKTTVSTMVATILKQTANGCGAFLGGISKNFESNLLLPGSSAEWMVTEADEYDRSFLQLTPDVAVITAMDADHLDIYGGLREVQESFRLFAAQIRGGGKLVTKRALKENFTRLADITVFTYSVDGPDDFFAAGLNLDAATRNYRFRLHTPAGLTPEIALSYPGLVNVENAVAAGAAAFLAGASFEEISAGLQRYQGVKRRFDIRYRDSRVLYIDDYAHHPEELRAFISSVKLLFPGKKITGIFQPHLYSRTRDFAPEFAQSLDLLDEAWLLPVYPARELPIEGVSSELILRMMKREKKLLQKNELAETIRHTKPEILLTMGAGDIDLIIPEIVETLKMMGEC